ncbi:hypothetical protein G5I_07174 [Acromyrmex echinatior]|uniref:Uncharacterized protein n=1 Tax=Acromyrmex echinatior TaxID=103372 RepID=F4WN27_ACREC|nr:hypothetical protein G5I_07174 [Acromyrmex echinatior]
MPPPLELSLDNSATILTLNNGEVPLRSFQNRARSIEQWCESVNDLEYETPRPLCGKTSPDGVLGRKRQAATRSGKSIKRAYTHANCETHDRQNRSKTLGDVMQNMRDFYNVHLDWTLLKLRVKREDWELHNTHNRLLDRHGRHIVCNLMTFSMECSEAIERGRNFRLLAEEELSKLLDFLTGYLPNSLKTTIAMASIVDPVLQALLC